MLTARKLIAVLCLAVLLFTVLAPGSHGWFAALVVPFCLFLELLIALALRPREQACDPRSLPFFSVVPSRAPPLA